MIIESIGFFIFFIVNGILLLLKQTKLSINKSINQSIKPVLFYQSNFDVHHRYHSHHNHHHHNHLKYRWIIILPIFDNVNWPLCQQNLEKKEKNVTKQQTNNNCKNQANSIVINVSIKTDCHLLIRILNTENNGKFFSNHILLKCLSI